tara:strand:- start:440 stop:808 length:369 start_codon:yes stop_codon:yes gene_type:complete
VSVREFDEGGEDYHNQIIEMYKKDKNLQNQMRGQFTQSPKDFRKRMMQIEATAQGFKKIDEQYFNNETRKTATDVEIEKINKATDDAMLRQNPDMVKRNLQFKDGFIIPLNSKDLIDKLGDI